MYLFWDMGKLLNDINRKEKQTMNYIEKEEALLNKLKATGYTLFDGDREKALDFVEKQFIAIIEYIQVFVEEKISVTAIRARLEGTENTESISPEAPKAYDEAVEGIKNLNDMFGELGLGIFADIDTEDVTAVKAFIGEYTRELYLKGIGESSDDE